VKMFFHPRPLYSDTNNYCVHVSVVDMYCHKAYYIMHVYCWYDRWQVLRGYGLEQALDPFE